MNYTLPILGSLQGTIPANSTGAASSTGIAALFDTQGNLNPVGVNTLNLNLSGSKAEGRHATLTGNATMDATAIVWPCNGTLTLSLPAASVVSARGYTVKNIGTGNVTVAANGSDTIDGNATYSMPTQFQTLTIQSNGTNGWDILAKI